MQFNTRVQHSSTHGLSYVASCYYIIQYFLYQKYFGSRQISGEKRAIYRENVSH